VDLEKFLASVKELLEQGFPAVIQPLDELEFYNEYRKRLQAKLDEKNKKVARDERLLQTETNQDEEEALLTSLHHAMRERDELELLLSQIHEQLEKYAKTA
jgi:predicted  nucleic acid-binding Zn-ribbon protein